MKILFLASNFVSETHTVSHEVVLNALIKEFSVFSDVYLATTHSLNIKKKKFKSFYYLGDFSSYLKKKKKYI